MKYIYLLKRGQLDQAKCEYFFYDDEPYTSLKKVNDYIDRMIECNKGYNISREAPLTGNEKDFMVTYNCLTSPDGGADSKVMRVRYHVKKLELR